jgi:hypothetical protein
MLQEEGGKVRSGHAELMSDGAKVGCGGDTHHWSGDAGRIFPSLLPMSIGAATGASASEEDERPDGNDARGTSWEGVHYSPDLIGSRGGGSYPLADEWSPRERTLRSRPQPLAGTVGNRPGPASCLKTIDWPLGDFYELDDQDCQ